ncbi:copper resistance CopC family protein [Massilia sp. TWP1-3-3]|uniref:copper resistance CopC family protein n=1 Tax=Massilia sp. TWP1-3-3 TaxID=2804573 RepID=UPI003CF69572
MISKNIVVAVAVFGGSLAATAAQAHAKIEAAEPRADSELAAAPKEITLHFNEKLEPAFSKIALLDARNVAISLPRIAIDKNDAKSMSAQLPLLKSGPYLVRWSTMTHDGHKAKGEYRFKVK